MSPVTGSPDREPPVLLAVDFTGLSPQRSLAAILASVDGPAVEWVDPLDADVGGGLTDWLDDLRARFVDRDVSVVVGNCMSSITALELAAVLPAVRLVVLVEPQLATRDDLVEEYLAAVRRLGIDGPDADGCLTAAERSAISLPDLADRFATHLWERCERFALTQGFSPSDARAFADELGGRQRSWLAYLATAAHRRLPVLGETPVCLLGDALLSKRAPLFASVSTEVRTVVVDAGQVHSSAEAQHSLLEELESAGL